MLKRHKQKHHRYKAKSKRGKVRWHRVLVLSIVFAIILIIILNYILAYVLGVSLVTFTNDILIISGVNTPTINEIKDLPVETINSNVDSFIKTFNEVAKPPELVRLDEGSQGLRIFNKDEVVLEATMLVENGSIVDIDYSGIHLESGGRVIELQEKMFRMIFSGEVPESFDNALKLYSKSRSRFQVPE